MKGLELSGLFYREVIKEFLRTQYPEYKERIAVGLAGEGSECSGCDDELSRDHDWGARICLWMTKDDYEKTGKELQYSLENIAQEFRGYPVIWIPGRSGAMQTELWYRKFLSLERPPQTVGEWLRIPEHHLAAACNGTVFADPLGEFTAIRDELLLGYPEDIRLKKLAARCMTIAQAGQYNYPRLRKRNDLVGALLAKNEFIHAVISAVYLLNNQYTPFYKWMYFGMCRLPEGGKEIGDLLRRLAEAGESGQSEEIIEEICRSLIRKFREQDITDVPEEETYLVRHGESIHRHIYLAALRDTDPWTDSFSMGGM